VTAKAFDRRIDAGSNVAIIKAIKGKPKAAAQAAFIRIRAITPALTALPIRRPWGFLTAWKSGTKIIVDHAPVSNSGQTI
jgi:hypothetical protein